MSPFPKIRSNSYVNNKKEFSSRLRKIVGFRTSNLRIYEVAFIHRSASFSLPDGQRINNERLEFLRDSILDAILSDYLFEKFPDASEGFMTKIRSRIVNHEILNQLAVAMGIDRILVSNVSPAHTTRYLYGDALEALIGALFIDKGFKKTKNLFIKKVFNRYLNLDTIIETDSDYKSMVFEWIQKHKSNLTFEHKEEYDFQHKKSFFSATLKINDDEYGTGQGPTKKEAEQEAAARAWEKLKELPVENS